MQVNKGASPMSTVIEKKGRNDTGWIGPARLTYHPQQSNANTTLATYHQHQDAMLPGDRATMWIFQQPNGLVLESDTDTCTDSPDPNRRTPCKLMDCLGDKLFPSTSTPCTIRFFRRGIYRDVTEGDTAILSREVVGSIPNTGTPSVDYKGDPEQGVIMSSC